MEEGSRVFSGAKRVDSRALNRVGAQPARAVLARLLYRLRSSSHDPVVAELAREGMVVVEEFLPADEFRRLAEESDCLVRRALPRWVHQAGSTVVREYRLGRRDVVGYPQLGKWREDTRLLAWAGGAERHHVTGASGAPVLQEVLVGTGREPDPQNALHIDMVFHTHKLWLYLTDVDVAHGPLVYVPRSHRFDVARLVAEYRDSNDPGRCTDPSRRVREDEVVRRRLAPRVITVPANTLVIADTSGYHCRAPGQPGAVRRSLHMSFRHDPFRIAWPRSGRARPRVTSSSA